MSKETAAQFTTMADLDKALLSNKVTPADYVTLAKALREKEKAAILSQAGGRGFAWKIVPPGISKKTGKPYKSVVEVQGNHRPTNVGPALLRELVEWITKDSGKQALDACDKCAALNAANAD